MLQLRLAGIAITLRIFLVSDASMWNMVEHDKV